MNDIAGKEQLVTNTVPFVIIRSLGRGTVNVTLYFRLVNHLSLLVQVLFSQVTFNNVVHCTYI